MNYGVIATGNQYIFIRCAERHPFRQGQGAKKDHPLKEGDNRRIVWQRPASEEAKPIVTPNTKTDKIKYARLDISPDFV